MRIGFLLILVLSLFTLQGETARADCSALEALINGDGSAQDLDIREAMEACGDPSVLGLIYNREAVEMASPVSEVTDIAGYWVNDYWIHVAAGIAVPVIETLEIAGDGRLERRALRFYDSNPGRYLDDADLEMVLPNYAPLVAEGTVSRNAEGRMTVVGLRLHDYIADARLKQQSPQDHEMQVQMALVSMPDISRPFQVARTDNTLVIHDASGQTRTYKKFDRVDVERLHALILTAEISAARNWTCLRDKMFAGGQEQTALREISDIALKIANAHRALQQLTADAHNAALKNPELSGSPEPDAMKAAADRIRDLYTGPEGQRFIKELESTPPFGCS